MELIEYSNDYYDIWEQVCETSPISTIMHTRKYLSYHESKFIDRSIILRSNKGNIALLPAARNLKDSELIISHPGISFGGLIHNGFLKGDLSIESLKLICEYFSSKGFRKFIYKSIPYIYHNIPCQDDIYSLYRLKARKIRCDLSCTVDLDKNIKLSSRRKRSLKKASRNNIKISEDMSYLKNYWTILINNLKSKYDTNPTHSYEEIKKLVGFFPKNITLITGLIEDEVIGGVLLYLTKNVCHCQYIGSNSKGNKFLVLDLIINYCIKVFKEKGFKWFDFGISNENNGEILNAGLYKFKSEFGGSGIVHDFYEIDLN